MNKHARIIELNDKLRTTFKGGRVRMTPAAIPTKAFAPRFNLANEPVKIILLPLPCLCRVRQFKIATVDVGYRIGNLDQRRVLRFDRESAIDDCYQTSPRSHPRQSVDS